MRHSLTAPFVQSLKAPTDRAHETYWDSGARAVRGFCLRITQAGARTWFAVYRHGGRLRWYRIGTSPTLSLADAREMARNALADVQKGNDPAADKQAARKAESFAHLCERYLDEYARHRLRPGTLQEYERIIRNRLLPLWGNRKPNDIARADVIALVKGIRDSAPYEANRVLAMVSIVFNFGVENEIVEGNPASHMKKWKSAEHPRDRALTAEEIATVWSEFDPVLRLLLSTGQRKSEVCGMRWSETNADVTLWTIPSSRTKNGREHRVPILGEAARLLREKKRGSANDLVFPGYHGKPLDPRPALERAIAASGVDFQLHDLRRTMATICGDLGVSDADIGDVLNHSKGTVTALHYNHSTHDKVKRAALTKWDRWLARVTGAATPG
jgi:integrase